MGRTPCCDKNGLKKGPWTPEEDQKLIDYIQKHGYGNWKTLSKNAGLQRCGKSCRLRWTNYLTPDIKRGRFSCEEEETIIQLHSILGNKWSAIAARLPGRTDNEIKNYWNTHIRKRLLKMGIDPVTHSPRLDLLDISSVLRSSLYNSSQMNLSSLLRGQELLKLASSLVLSDRGNHNFRSTQYDNQQNHQSLYNPPTDNQIIRLVQAYQIQPQSQEWSAPFVSYPLSESQFVENYAEGYTSNTNHFSTQDFPLSHWQSSEIFTASDLNEDYPALPSYYDYASDEIIIDPTINETSNFHWSSCNQNFGFTSVISTPSSSTTPLNSNSIIVNRGSSTEDERESYGSRSLLKFGIPDLIDVNYAFM